MAEMADEETTDGGEEQKPSLIKKLMMPVALSLVTVGIAVGALNFFGVHAKYEQDKASGP